MWLHAHRPLQYPHMSACGVYVSACINSHTFQTHTPQSQHSSGRVSPKGPTAFNQLGHEALQMGLSAGWDRRGRVGGGGVGGGLVIVNIFAPPLPRRIASASRETAAGRPGPRWPRPRSAHAFSSAASELTFSITAPRARGVLKRALCDFGQCLCWMCFSSLSNDGLHFSSVFSDGASEMKFSEYRTSRTSTDAVNESTT